MRPLLHFFGQFHPVIIHFPVALLLVAAVAEGLYLFWKKPFLAHTASVNLHLSAVSAIVAAALGWALAATSGTDPDLKATLFWHRWLGTATALFAGLALFLWWYHRNQPSRIRVIAFRVSLIAGAVLVTITGHLGGKLVYGLDYFTFSLK